MAFISMISIEPWALYYLCASRVIYLLFFFPPEWIIVPFSETKSGLNWLFLTYSFFSFILLMIVLLWLWYFTGLLLFPYPLTLWLWNLNLYQKHLKAFHSSGFLDPVLRISDSKSLGWSSVIHTSDKFRYNASAASSRDHILKTTALTQWAVT